MARIEETISRHGSDWQAHTPPLDPDARAAALERIGGTLPESLIELYGLCDTGEGSLQYQPWNFVLWGMEEVAGLREHEHYRKNYPDIVLFGSSGGGEYFGLSPDGEVFFMDPIAGRESFVVVSKTFEDFVLDLGFLPPYGIPVVA